MADSSETVTTAVKREEGTKERSSEEGWKRGGGKWGSGEVGRWCDRGREEQGSRMLMNNYNYSYQVT